MDNNVSTSEILSDSSPEMTTNKMISLESAQQNMLKIDSPDIEKVYKEMEGKDLPMIFKYHFPNENIIDYVGTAHSSYLNKEQLLEQTKGLKTAFDEFKDSTSSSKKRLVLIEGSESGLITNKFTSFEDASKNGEMGETIWYATDAGIDIMSPDIPHEETLKFMKEEGVDDLTIALSFAFRSLHTALKEKNLQEDKHLTQREVIELLVGVSTVYTDWERETVEKDLAEIRETGGLDTPEGKTKAQEYIDKMLPQLNTHLQENSKFIKNEVTGDDGIQLLSQQGIDSNGDPTYISEYDPEKHYLPLVSPFINNPDNPKGMLNYLSAKISDNRERYILEQIVDKVNDGYDLFIVFGNSHAIQEGPGLIAAGCNSEDYPIKIVNQLNP